MEGHPQKALTWAGLPVVSLSSLLRLLAFCEVGSRLILRWSVFIYDLLGVSVPCGMYQSMSNCKNF